MTDKTRAAMTGKASKDAFCLSVVRTAELGTMSLLQDQQRKSGLNVDSMNDVLEKVAKATGAYCREMGLRMSEENPDERRLKVDGETPGFYGQTGVVVPKNEVAQKLIDDFNASQNVPIAQRRSKRARV
jgi:hypothetical protein